MRLRGDIVKQLADQGGVDVDHLAIAVRRTGLDGDRANSAVTNWMSGRDHPRCKAQDIRKLASTLGVAPSTISRFTSQVRDHRGSTRKARLLVDLIRGKGVDEALNALAFSPKRAAVNVRKCLQAAIADAEQADADLGSLIVVEARVDEGTPLKRFKAKDRGRAHPIVKQTSHITVGVQERQ